MRKIYEQIHDFLGIEELGLSQTEMRILQYLHHNLYNIEQIGVKDIANHCCCSTAAIHRFVCKFGCSGYKQFKTALIASQSLSESEGTKFGKELAAMVQYIDSLDVEPFILQLQKYIGKRIYVYGAGGSYLSAMYLARLLNEANIDCDAYTVFERVGMARHCDAAIFISNTGQTQLILEQERLHSAAHIPTFAITKEGSLLAKQAQIALTHNKIFNPHSHVERESQMQIMMIIEKVFGQIHANQ